MSVEAARVFVNRMFTDKAFLDEISSIADLEERQKAVKAAGYDFSREDAEKLVPPGWTLEQLSALKPDGDELPDALLEAVAGGKGNQEPSSSGGAEPWVSSFVYWSYAVSFSVGASAAAAVA